MNKITLLFSLMLAMACSSRTDTHAEADKLMQLSRDWSLTAGTDSLEKTLSYWAADALVMPPDAPPIKGRDAIRKMLEDTKKIPGFKISWEPIQATVSESGDLAYMVEQNQVTVNDSLGKPFTTFNKAITIWRKEPDGTWKNVVDMWSPDPSGKK
ncbi:MAG TPA: DUF4440 domain-containing protein [Puia sp.]|nr:DUF4440 domain-containing protein [Puia sp.]